MELWFTHYPERNTLRAWLIADNNLRVLLWKSGLHKHAVYPSDVPGELYTLEDMLMLGGIVIHLPPGRPTPRARRKIGEVTSMIFEELFASQGVNSLSLAA